MKSVIPYLIWILGIPASIALSFQFKSTDAGYYGNGGEGELAFAWPQFLGYLILFFVIGLIALQLDVLISKQKKAEFDALINDQKKTD